MSIVITTHDNLDKERQETRKQEHKISKDSSIAKWRMNDISKPSPIMKVLGLIALPIVAFWSLLVIGAGFALTLVLLALKGLGAIFGKR